MTDKTKGPEEPEVPSTEQQAPETPEVPEVDPGVQALKILEDIQGKINQPQAPAPAVAPTYESVREKIKAQTGFTDEQVDFHLRSVAEANAPIAEKMAWLELESERKDVSLFKEDMKKELERYPVTMRGDKVLLEKVYFMTKGMKMETPNSAAPKAPAPVTPGSVVRRTISQYPGSESGMDGGGSPEKKTMTDTEKELARNMGISEETWLRNKGNKVIQQRQRANV